MGNCCTKDDKEPSFTDMAEVNDGVPQLQPAPKGKQGIPNKYAATGSAGPTGLNEQTPEIELHGNGTQAAMQAAAPPTTDPVATTDPPRGTPSPPAAQPVAPAKPTPQQRAMMRGAAVMEDTSAETREAKDALKDEVKAPMAGFGGAMDVEEEPEKPEEPEEPVNAADAIEEMGGLDLEVSTDASPQKAEEDKEVADSADNDPFPNAQFFLTNKVKNPGLRWWQSSKKLWLQMRVQNPEKVMVGAAPPARVRLQCSEGENTYLLDLILAAPLTNIKGLRHQLDAEGYPVVELDKAEEDEWNHPLKAPGDDRAKLRALGDWLQHELEKDVEDKEDTPAV